MPTLREKESYKCFGLLPIFKQVEDMYIPQWPTQKPALTHESFETPQLLAHLLANSFEFFFPALLAGTYAGVETHRPGNKSTPAPCQR
jgi:hypothetical protein